MERDAQTGAHGPLEWEGPAIGLLDLDAFFASVEQLDHPAWRGRPVVVGAPPEEHGVVSTASYEARRYGIRSAMPSATARRLCPDAIWTRGHFERYHEVSRQVMGLLLDETPLVEQVSVDEAFFDVTPGRFSRESPVEICARVQARVRELGVTCSIGLGTGKTVAKIASEREKPRGLTVVPPGCERAFLAPLEVRAMSGIGQATQARLEAMGIRTLGQLAHADQDVLERELGVAGPRLAMRAAGLEHAEVVPPERQEGPKSLSCERTFPEDLVGRDELRAAVGHVCALVARRLRAQGLRAALVTLKVRSDAMRTRTARATLDVRTDDERVLARAAESVLEEVWAPGVRVRLVGVATSCLDHDPRPQASLFAPQGRERDRSELGRVGALVRARFGDAALGYGRDLRFSLARDAGDDDAGTDGA